MELMKIDKYNISYFKTYSNKKPVFVFVNHKTAVLCWAQLIKKIKYKPDVITFDSHSDFYGGLINGKDLLNEQDYYGSKYVPHLKHFTKSKEFLDWDLLDVQQNLKFIREDKKFLLSTNDNFIDVAFMKDIISDVYWYFLNIGGNRDSGKCDDFNNKNHLFIKSEVKKFKELKKPFILDIDLDFFAKEIDWAWDVIPKKTIDKYLELQKRIFNNEHCLGLTIALEPYFCGGTDNCISLFKTLCDKFGFNLVFEAEEMIKKATSSNSVSHRRNF
jgi:hypothetical protein